METFVLALLVLAVGWQVLQLREKGVAPAHKTLLRVAVESEEMDELSLPKESAGLRKKLELRVPLVPGMYIEGHGAEHAWKVERTVVVDDLLVIVLAPVRIPATQVQNEVQSLQRFGWEVDG